MNRIKIEGRTPEERETYYQFKIAELLNENRNLKKKLKRRDVKIKDLESTLRSCKTALEASRRALLELEDVVDSLRGTAYGRWNY